MGTTLTREMIQIAGTYLDDPDHISWNESQLLDWLNYAESAICILKPDAFSKTATRQLDPGVLQTKADDAVMVGTPTLNMGSDGLTVGRSIQEKSLDAMNMSPTWPTDTATSEVKYFIRIPGDGLSFYIWPPATSPAPYIQEAYPASPTVLVEDDFDAGTETINLPDIYINPILDMMLFRACDMLKARAPEMAAKGQAALQRAIQTVTGKTSIDMESRMRERANV